MKRIKYTTGDLILLSIYGICLTTGISECFTAKTGELHKNINICIWVVASISWFFGYKLVQSRLNRVIEAADKSSTMIEYKAMSSAPSEFTTKEKTVYEEGFKDGINYLKNEMNSVY